MSYQDNIIAFQNKFNDEWLAGPYSDKVFYFENIETGNSSRNDDPWITMEFSPEFGGQVTMDSTIFDATARYDGIVFFNIYIPGGQGLVLATRVGEFVKEIFRVQQFSYGNSGAITTRRPTSEPLGNDENSLYKYRLLIPYFRDVIESPPNYLVSEASVFLTTESESLLEI